MLDNATHSEDWNWEALDQAGFGPVQDVKILAADHPHITLLPGPELAEWLAIPRSNHQLQIVLGNIRTGALIDVHHLIPDLSLHARIALLTDSQKVARQYAPDIAGVRWPIHTLIQS